MLIVLTFRCFSDPTSITSRGKNGQIDRYSSGEHYTYIILGFLHLYVVMVDRQSFQLIHTFVYNHARDASCSLYAMLSPASKRKQSPVCVRVFRGVLPFFSWQATIYCVLLSPYTLCSTSICSYLPIFSRSSRAWHPLFA